MVRFRGDNDVKCLIHGRHSVTCHSYYDFTFDFIQNSKITRMNFSLNE